MSFVPKRDLSMYKEFFDRACISWDNYFQRKIQLNYAKDVKGLLSLIDQQLNFLERVKRAGAQIIEELENRDNLFKKALLDIENLIPEYIRVLEMQKSQLSISFECYNDESRGVEEKLNVRLKRMADNLIDSNKEVKAKINNFRLKKVVYTGLAILLLAIGTLSSVKSQETKGGLSHQAYENMMNKFNSLQSNTKVNIIWAMDPSYSEKINLLIIKTIRHTLALCDSANLVKEVNVKIGYGFGDRGAAQYSDVANTISINDKLIYATDDYEILSKLHPNISPAQKDTINANSLSAVVDLVNSIVHETNHMADIYKNRIKFVQAEKEWEKYVSDSSKIDFRKMNKLIENILTNLFSSEKKAISMSLYITQDFLLGNELSDLQKKKINEQIELDRQKLEDVKREEYSDYRKKWVRKGVEKALPEFLAWVKTLGRNYFTFDELEKGLGLGMGDSFKHVNAFSFVSVLEEYKMVKTEFGSSVEDTKIVLK